MYKSNINNTESPFTEMFSLLKHYECTSCGAIETGYHSDKLQSIHQHVDNAINVVLRGMQEVGLLFGITQYERNLNTLELNHIGFFVSAMSNLTVALNTLRLDTDYEIKSREKLSDIEGCTKPAADELSH